MPDGAREGTIPAQLIRLSVPLVKAADKKLPFAGPEAPPACPGVAGACPSRTPVAQDPSTSRVLGAVSPSCLEPEAWRGRLLWIAKVCLYADKADQLREWAQAENSGDSTSLLGPSRCSGAMPAHSTHVLSIHHSQSPSMGAGHSGYDKSERYR